MKENKRNRSESNERSEQDQLRNTQSGESTREVRQDRSQSDNLREADKGSGRSYDYGTPGSQEAGSDRGNVSTGRSQRSSRENMAGTSDMSHDQEIGKGRDVRRSQDSSQNLAPKSSVTGSDFDGQNSI
jgi:hypothetical protein